MVYRASLSLDARSQSPTLSKLLPHSTVRIMHVPRVSWPSRGESSKKAGADPCDFWLFGRLCRFALCRFFVAWCSPRDAMSPSSEYLDGCEGSGGQTEWASGKGLVSEHEEHEYEYIKSCNNWQLLLEARRASIYCQRKTFHGYN